MNRSIAKPIVIGIILGAAIFFIPFIVIRIILFVLIAGLLFRLFAGRRSWRRFNGNYTLFTDKIRSMSEEEYAQFKLNSSRGCGYHQQTNPSR